MNIAEYKKMVENIQAEIESLEIQQEDVERRLARLKQALLGLAPLAEDSPPGLTGLMGESITAAVEAMSITDAARQILQAATTPLAPTEIKQQLLNMGKDLSKQKNVMASIHSMLKRLLESGEIETTNNGLAYQWKGVRRFPRSDQSAKMEALRQRRVAAGRTGGRIPPPPSPDDIDDTLKEVWKKK
jgi:hypothetical protein